MVKREAFMLRVKKDMLEEYERRHAAVWPDMLEALPLFLSPEGILFGYVELEDSLDEANARMAKEEANKKWQDSMAPFFETDGEHADKSFQKLKHVFYLP